MGMIEIPIERKEPVMRWIPCSERLPEEDTSVLVTVYFMGSKWNAYIKSNCYVDIASYIGGEWLSYMDEYKILRNRHKVVAWMPRPEPYREGSEE